MFWQKELLCFGLAEQLQGEHSMGRHFSVLWAKVACSVNFLFDYSLRDLIIKFMIYDYTISYISRVFIW